MRKILLSGLFILNLIIAFTQTPYRLEMIAEGNYGTPNGDIFVRNTTISPAVNSAPLYQTANSTTGIDVLQDFKVVGDKAIMVDKPNGQSKVYITHYPSMELIEVIPSGYNGGQTIGIASPTKAYVSFGNPSEIMMADLVNNTLTLVADPNNEVSSYSNVGMVQANGIMYVELGSRIVKIDTVTNTVIGTILPAVGTITGIVADDNQEKIWVMGGSTIKSIDLLDNETVSAAITMPVTGRNVRYYDEKIYFWNNKKLYIYDIAQNIIPTAEIYTSQLAGGAWDFGYTRGFDIDMNTGDFVITSANGFANASTFEVVDGTTFEIIESASMPGCMIANNCRVFTYPGTAPLVFPVPDLASLSDVNEECSVTLTAPTADNGTVTATTTDPTTYDEQGTYTVTWTYNNNDGSTTQEQTVIIDDVTAPVIDTVASISIACDFMVTAPVAQDNCEGEITGTTTDLITFDSAGSYTINWTFDDGNGNSVVKQQLVEVSCSDLGIDKIEFFSKIYPNPASTTLNVILGEAIASSLTISDVNGNNLIHQSISGIETSIAIDKLANGVYFLSVNGQTTRFVVSK